MIGRKSFVTTRLLVGRRSGAPFRDWPNSAAGFLIHVPGRLRLRCRRAGLAGAMAAAGGGDSDGDSEELVLTPAQLIHSLEQVPRAGAAAWAGGMGLAGPTGARGAGHGRVFPSRRWGSVADIFLAFLQAWLNEKFAPELLESKPEIIECVVEQLDHMVGSPGSVVLQAGPGCLVWQKHA